MEKKKQDENLINQLLSWMSQNNADYTNTFCYLMKEDFVKDKSFQNSSFKKWYKEWRNRIKQNKKPDNLSLNLMRSTNPLVIPRNHKVEEALDAANNNDLVPLHNLLKVLKKPYERPKIKEYQIAFWINDNHSEEHYSFLKSAKLLGIGQGNIGFGNAHNKLMEILFTEYDYYFGLNPDGYLMKGALRESTNLCINRDDNAFIELASFPVEHPKWYDPNNLDTLWVSGAAFLMSKKIWNEVGAFDPELHMYCEDVDLSWKIKASGFELKVCPSAKFFHDVTSRHFDAESIERERGRAKIMLQGAYYLCAKWGGQELLDVVKNQLKSEFNVLEKELQKPSRLIPSDIADEVTDFRHGLRFSPSRFWE